jgi:pimeloyl-ACP methyl ester carboxylesterase
VPLILCYAVASRPQIAHTQKKGLQMQCDLEDISIFYEAHGAGRLIVMLPGRPSDHRIMELFMEPVFTQGRDGWLRLYPDLPGTGLTPAVDRLATHDHMLDTMLAFIDRVIPGQRFVLAGYSYGGYLARGIISHRAASVDGLLLCAPQVKADPARARLPERSVIVEDPQLLVRLDPDFAPLVEHLVVVQNERVTEALHSVLAEGPEPDHPFNERLEAAGAASFEVDPQLTPLFGGPTLIVTARQDHLCGFRDAWDLIDRFPRATFAVLDRAGHFVAIEEEGLCRSLIAEWLDRVSEWADLSPAG